MGSQPPKKPDDDTKKNKMNESYKDKYLKYKKKYLYAKKKLQHQNAKNQKK